MSPHESFVKLMAQLRAGDEDAAAAVWQRFVGRLVALAHNQLATWIQRKVDPEEVVQSVYKSFFVRYRDNGQFDFADWDSLWGLLAQSTIWKCHKRIQYFLTDGRDAGREVPLEAGDNSLDSLTRALAPDPTPEEAAILTELVGQLLRGLDDDDRKIIEMILQGYTVVEIHDAVGLSERTVQRVHERVKKRLERMTKADTPEP